MGKKIVIYFGNIEDTFEGMFKSKKEKKIRLPNPL